MAYERIKEKLCQALDRAEQALEFYAGASRACSEELGRDVYDMLRNEEQEHIEHLKRIQRGLSEGEAPSRACRLHPRESESREAQGEEIFRRMAARYDRGGEPCLSVAETANVALDLEARAARFHDAWAAEAEEDAERAFAERKADEARRHGAILRDMRSYYEDPEEWALGSGRQSSGAGPGDADS